MSEVVAPSRLDEIAEMFETASQCAQAPNCKRVAEAMTEFNEWNNQQVQTVGRGLLIFADEPAVACPNRDQLLCQDRIEQSG